jgi:hypothetical protein
MIYGLAGTVCSLVFAVRSPDETKPPSVVVAVTSCRDSRSTNLHM